MDNTNIPTLNTQGLGLQGGAGLGLNFNIPDLAGLKPDDEQEVQKFSWTNEIESINAAMVQERVVLEDIDQHTCLAKLVTLEGEYFNLRCSVAKGILVTETNRPEFDTGKVYESLEMLLMRVSPMYIKAFTSAE